MDPFPSLGTGTYIAVTLCLSHIVYRVWRECHICLTDHEESVMGAVLKELHLRAFSSTQLGLYIQLMQNGTRLFGLWDSRALLPPEEGVGPILHLHIH